jgi:Ser/Thr protein kinase RdoA (MazF antagonist)
MNQQPSDRPRDAVAHPEHLHAIANAFAIPSPIDAITPLGRGLINDTYRVDAAGVAYVLQRINRAVFPDPSSIMTNMQALDRHARQESHGGIRIPALIPTRSGHAAEIDGAGAVWRLMELIDGAVTLTSLQSLAQARSVGALLGRFHTLLQSLPADALGVSLPGFHESPVYLARFLTCVEGVAAADRAGEVGACIDFVVSRRPVFAQLAEAAALSRFPPRLVHGDPKLDNVLFVGDPPRACALIDFDTLQPGLILHDIGDCLRSCCNRGGESVRGAAAASFDLDLVEAILAGYAEHARCWLAASEVALMPEAIRLMPLELGLRFLTDHLEGDHYFKVAEHGQNLQKAQVQFALVTDIERKMSRIRDIIDAHFAPADA